MPLVRGRTVDPVSPKMLMSESLTLSQEQREYVSRILNLFCSDSRSAEKAFLALQYVLTGGSVVIPHISSLNPSSAVLGSPSFTLHVLGTGFGTYSQIVWNSSVEPTTVVSETELTTIVNMDTAVVAMQIPVLVQTGDGVMSNVVFFDLQDAALRTGVARASTESARASESAVKTLPKKEEPSLSEKVREANKSEK